MRAAALALAALALAALALAALAPLTARAADERWLARLPELAPALRACLEEAGPGAHVFHAEPPAGGGWVGVYLRRGDGVAEHCLAHVTGEVVMDRGTDFLPRLTGSAAPLFFLDRRCVDARRVEAPDGRILGWLAYPACG